MSSDYSQILKDSQSHAALPSKLLLRLIHALLETFTLRFYDALRGDKRQAEFRTALGDEVVERSSSVVLGWVQKIIFGGVLYVVPSEESPASIYFCSRIVVSFLGQLHNIEIKFPNGYRTELSDSALYHLAWALGVSTEPKCPLLSTRRFDTDTQGDYTHLRALGSGRFQGPRPWWTSLSMRPSCSQPGRGRRKNRKYRNDGWDSTPAAKEMARQARAAIIARGQGHWIGITEDSTPLDHGESKTATEHAGHLSLDDSTNP